MLEVFRDVGEVVETDNGDSLFARTISLQQTRDLGPPDLIHIVKNRIDSEGTLVYGQTTLSTYHHLQGLSTSPANVAAYLMDLQKSLDEVLSLEGVVGSVAKSPWKIVEVSTFAT
jgi:hypothetical protein